MSQHIQTKVDSTKGDDDDFDMYFPLFVFALRDFTLQLKIDGRDVSADEYMEHCLTLRPEKKPNDERYNAPRICIRKYFTKRSCFTFDMPTYRANLVELDKLPDSKLSPDFVEETNKFLNFMFEKAPIKKLENGKAINGRSK